ncbi:MAG TPA: hypothetical protein DCY03_06330 [Planctomycetaceae bacterium]|nr:hypothetical protein [Planctomycetaceae bacterium]
MDHPPSLSLVRNHERFLWRRTSVNTLIALLRGINVGVKIRLPMKELILYSGFSVSSVFLK